MGLQLQSQFNGLIGSVSSAVSSVSENLQVDENKLKMAEYRVKKHKLLRKMQQELTQRKLNNLQEKALMIKKEKTDGKK